METQRRSEDEPTGRRGQAVPLELFVQRMYYGTKVWLPRMWQGEKDSEAWCKEQSIAAVVSLVGVWVYVVRRTAMRLCPLQFNLFWGSSSEVPVSVLGIYDFGYGHGTLFMAVFMPWYCGLGRVAIMQTQQCTNTGPWNVRVSPISGCCVCRVETAATISS